MSADQRVEELAAKATEGFFAELFRHVPAGTTGDFPPDATMAFEAAAKDAVRTILRNQPTRKYVVAYEVEWAPETNDPLEDAPMDRTHTFTADDERVVGWEIVAIGSTASVVDELREQEADAQEDPGAARAQREMDEDLADRGIGMG